jgi:quinol monooxygenase YgiN
MPAALSPIVLSARVVALPAARRELLQALVSWAGTVRREAGMLASNVYEDVEGSGTFRVEAEWANAAALDDHLRSDDFGVLLGALELLAMPIRLTVTSTAREYGTEPLTPIRRLRETLRTNPTTPPP